jgi:Holliday junction DNA helicase RuvA
MVDPALMQLSGAIEAKALPRPVSDAISALTNLGYPQAQAQSAIAAAMTALGDGAETGQLIRQGLKELAK